jgi:hypothetical protein
VHDAFDTKGIAFHVKEQVAVKRSFYLNAPNVSEFGGLEEISVFRLFRTTATDGKTYEVSYYNLDMVLALGFRVRSPMTVRFRQWAADKLKEYITKGFVLDDDRLKKAGRGRI